MSTNLATLINHFKTDYDPNQKVTITQLKQNEQLKSIAKYIRGGISKLTKANMQTLTQSLTTYTLDEYNINNKRIIPDDEQKIIIKAPINKNIRVIAGAGTGKTTTITCRVKYLIDHHTTPDKLL